MANDVALVLEGGGYRGVFTAGVLDVLMERGVYDFGSVWAAGFRARQIGRNLRIMLAFRDDKRLMSYFSLATTGSIAGDFLYYEVQDELDPCDVDTFNASSLRMFAVASDVVLGAPRYFEIRALPDDIEKIRASSSLPLVSTVVTIDGHRYLDGGTTDSVPVEAALGLSEVPYLADYEPASRALVVLTRQRDYVKGQRLERMALLSRRYAEYPLYVEALRTRAERYMAQRERIWELEEEGRALLLMPRQPVTVPTTAPSGAALLDLYLKGRSVAEQRIDEILESLK